MSKGRYDRPTFAERKQMLAQDPGQDKRNGASPLPTPEQLDGTTADLQLAVYIVGSMLLMGSLKLETGAGRALLAEGDNGDPLLEAIDDVRTAIREAMPVMDLDELKILHNADKVKRQ